MRAKTTSSTSSVLREFGVGVPGEHRRRSSPGKSWWRCWRRCCCPPTQQRTSSASVVAQWTASSRLAFARLSEKSAQL